MGVWGYEDDQNDTALEGWLGIKAMYMKKHYPVLYTEHQEAEERSLRAFKRFRRNIKGKSKKDRRKPMMEYEMVEQQTEVARGLYQKYFVAILKKEKIQFARFLITQLKKKRFEQRRLKLIISFVKQLNNDPETVISFAEPKLPDKLFPRFPAELRKMACAVIKQNTVKLTSGKNQRRGEKL